MWNTAAFLIYYIISDLESFHSMCLSKFSSLAIDPRNFWDGASQSSVL